MLYLLVICSFLLLSAFPVYEYMAFSLFLLLMNESESESRSVVSNSLWPDGLYSPWNSPGQITGVGSLSLLQGLGYFQLWTVVNTIAMHIIYKSTCRHGFISLFLITKDAGSGGKLIFNFFKKVSEPFSKMA